MVHIDDLPLLANAQVVLGILFSCVAHQPSYLTQIVPIFCSFLFLLVGFNRKVTQVCEDIMCLES